MKMVSMEMRTFFVLFIFVLGLMNFPQVSHANEYPCNKVGDCYPFTPCLPWSIPICIKHFCVCVAKTDLRAPTSTPSIN
ncbi:hypothetical protein CTI12_AA273090 [Artemisia annua]|uniref:Late nodulin n=1 Tax=Artemisia annua TaxID=35608 RepID=A0A2U1NF46_ARTAN|nr:hypothetical protein CTI12_AA273090 [Artemisia annua]